MKDERGKDREDLKDATETKDVDRFACEFIISIVFTPVARHCSK